MGTLKTKRSKELKNLKKAHNMAEAFAIHRTGDFLKTFLGQSGLGEVMFGYYSDIQATWTKNLESKKIELEAANVRGNDIEKQTIQNEISDLEANIDTPLMTQEEYFKKMEEDLNIPFGGALALAYAIGYADHANGATVRTVTALSKKAETPDEIDRLQMELPGIRIADENTKPPLIGETTPEHVAALETQPRIITDLNLVK